MGTQTLLTPPRTPQRLPQHDCGVPGDFQDTRVANGIPVPSPGAWPWMARLLYSANEESPSKTFCGGALVSSRHIITAAHCIKDEKIGKPIAVVLGDVDVTTEYDCMDTSDSCGAKGAQGLECYNKGWCAEPAVKYNVKRITVAPKYNRTGGRTEFGGRFPINDIAVINQLPLHGSKKPLERKIKFSYPPRFFALSSQSNMFQGRGMFGFDALSS